MLPARPAEFVELQPARRGLLILGGGVIAILAITALQRNNLARHSIIPFVYFPAGAWKPCPRRSADIRRACSPELIPGLKPRGRSVAPEGARTYLIRLPSILPSAPCWARLFRPLGSHPANPRNIPGSTRVSRVPRSSPDFGLGRDRIPPRLPHPSPPICGEGRLASTDR